ncbi:MCP four helix bundle domain-containing protein [Thiotrichales bacterium HSG1]|nr:MCP four helix bundle domain-containing protein [Thiotrichales bacterium HSG1]
MQIRYKFLINTIITIIFLASIGGIGYYYINHVANTSSLMSKLEVEPILKINSLETIAWERWLILIEHSGISDYEVMQKLETNMVKLDKQITTSLEELENTYVSHQGESAEHAQTLEQFKDNWQKFQQVAEKILTLSNDFTKEDALNLIVKDGKLAYKKTINDLRNLITQHRENMQILNKNALQSRWEAITMIVVLVILLIFTSSLVSTVIIKQILKQVGGEPAKIAAITKKIADGNLDIKYETEVVTGIYADIQVMVQNLKTVIVDIIEVSKGLAEGKKIIANAQYHGDFIQIKTALDTTSTKLMQTTIVNNEQNWIKTGQSNLNELIRGEQNITILAKNVIDFLCEYVEAQVGLFYLLQEDADQPYLKIISTYAYAKNNERPDQYLIGEGLVGQVAFKQKILVTDVPEDYVSIQSGTGEAVPRNILVMPFMYENSVKGAIEIGSFHEFTTTQLELLEQVMPNIGITMNTAESRTKMQALLQSGN